MVQDSSLSKRVIRSIRVSSYWSKDIFGIPHGHWPPRPSSLSCPNSVRLKHFSEKCGLESSMCTRGTAFLPCAVFGLKAFLALTKRLPSKSQMLDLFWIFQAKRSKLEWKCFSCSVVLNSTIVWLAVILILTVYIDDLRFLRTLPCYCKWILILISWWWWWVANEPTESNAINFRPFLL